MNPAFESDPAAVKVLGEQEIQERLYGIYLGLRRPGSSPRPVSPPPSISRTDPAWTGVEILKGELHTLRSELIRLRREKETLVEQLARRSTPLKSAGQPGGRRLFLSLMGAAVGLGLFSLSVGGRFLQASPPAGLEPTPYTVQVGVYDGSAPARRAVATLQELGFPAFWVESSRRRGGIHYRIYIGRFVTKGEAERERSHLLADPRFSVFQDAFVRVQ